jgi:DNA modification methylase
MDVKEGDGKRMHKNLVDAVLCGDCEQLLTDFPSNYFNLIVTSPPYADRRKNTYGGIHPDKFVDWFLSKSAELLRVLKPDGTFILNIKEKVSNGERHTFVLNLILEMRKQGWLWTEEFIWHKKNCYPGKWPNRFRDAWEPIFQFNKERKFKMFQEAVMLPIGEWSKKRLSKLSKTDQIRDVSKTQSGFGKNISNWIGRNEVYPTNVLHMPDVCEEPTNVLHMATECSYKAHSAAFPIDLPSWFIRLFSEKGDIVLDPFAGSGTTALAAKNLERHFIAIDIDKNYCRDARERLGITNKKLDVFES